MISCHIPGRPSRFLRGGGMTACARQGKMDWSIPR